MHWRGERRVGGVGRLMTMKYFRRSSAGRGVDADVGNERRR